MSTINFTIIHHRRPYKSNVKLTWVTVTKNGLIVMVSTQANCIRKISENFFRQFVINCRKKLPNVRPTLFKSTLESKKSGVLNRKGILNKR